MKLTSLLLATLFAVSLSNGFTAAAFAAELTLITNPLVDFAGHKDAVLAVGKLRSTRVVSEAEFLRMACEPDTVVLDARSNRMFQRLHLKGAVNLSFPDFTSDTLAGVIPAKTTRVLIYCNNNFTGSPSAFPMKMAPIALNLSTFVALHAYGYDNVYEIGPLLDVKTTRLPLEGLEVPAFAP